jgi:hypothetical protein
MLRWTVARFVVCWLRWRGDDRAAVRCPGLPGLRLHRHDVMDAPRDPGRFNGPQARGEEIGMEVRVIGIDIAKRYFQIHGVDVAGDVVLP